VGDWEKWRGGKISVYLFSSFPFFSNKRGRKGERERGRRRDRRTITTLD